MTNKKITKKSQVSKPRNRLFLVVADDSKELHQALYYAARRAATAGGEVALFRCIEPIEGQLLGGVTEIMEAEAELASKNLHLNWVLPMHPNPNVVKHKHLLKNISVTKPLPHNQLLKVLKNSKLVITDSGGIQEESAFFKKPCIVCREKTERGEGLGDFSWLCLDPV